ncbi:alpha-glucan family phosphorylase [Heliophilum fasciatum]|uniref:glycogen phosphorylase n=1 Tax=Heliophilum fasciatum TaxID=35700 RepID=A0A4R2RLX1_9FIRM|nr:alpha-glucan family phosphorylase [Heliophilum fasciatum]MCW2277591.1 starch phosphorylase [Heliophilum fasciatum]TCP64940.1 starch phosphorylase [Heliophilum fasciatum]
MAECYTIPGISRVAYFCMEYGLAAEMPIYSGGLGILAGDYIKAAKELSRPLVAIGILWRQGYTEQHIDENGQPYDTFRDYDFSHLQDTGITVKVHVRSDEVTCKVWLCENYGNVPLYLLDAGFPGSPHAWMTKQLYGGGREERIAAEIILGIGGIRALRALNLDVDAYHFNEGHAVFAGTELIREKMAEGHSFEHAWLETRQSVVFTTHTPVAAGNEVHGHDILQQMNAYNGLTYDQMRELGGDPFSMTVAGLRLAYMANGVSKLHGRTVQRMWGHLEGVPLIFSITNGVHPGTWQDPRIKQAFETRGDLWAIHMDNKRQLLQYVKDTMGVQLREESLLLGFARRAASYKRGDLIFRDLDIIDPYLATGKIQIIFSSKAHPADTMGKEIIANLVKFQKKYPNSVVFLENYNMEIAKKLVRGCDVWLNNPRRPQEASGTSGMKAAMNGVLNLTVEDGWVGEGVQHGINGWLLDFHPGEDTAPADQDVWDMHSLYRILLQEVLPTYSKNRKHWVEMMQLSIDMSRWQFSAHRMCREYYDLMYTPIVNNRKNRLLQTVM